VSLDARAHRRLAEQVFASLDETPAVAVRLLAAALGLADGPVGRFASAMDYYADRREFGFEPGGLATIKLAYDLRRAASAPDCDELLERLDGTDAAPWPQIRAAVALLRDARGREASHSTLTVKKAHTMEVSA